MATEIDIAVTTTTYDVTIVAEPNEYIVNITTGGGGGTQTLAQTLALGNTTGGENIVINDADSVQLENSSKLSQGIVDAGTGGNKGIALTCAVGYEWKWEVGEAYLTNLSGNQIDAKQYARSVPTPTDDDTKGFYAGSEWFTLTGIRYQCLSATTGDASWVLVDNIPNLQQVLNVADRIFKTESGNYTIQASDIYSYVAMIEASLGDGTILNIDYDIFNKVNGVCLFSAFKGDGFIRFSGVGTMANNGVENLTELNYNQGDVISIKYVGAEGYYVDIVNKSSGGGSSTWGSITGTLSSQTDLQSALDSKVDENTAITGATKTKITYDAKGLVTSGADATTADISDSINKRYVTDAQQTVIGNTTGTNSGDNATNTQYSGLASSKQDVATLLVDSIDKAILKNNYFWFLPNTVTNGSAASFAYSERISSTSFVLLLNGNILRGFISFSTTAVAGTIASMRQNNALQIQGYECKFTRKIQFNSNVSGQRFFCGISKGNQFAVATNVEPNTLTDIVGVCQLSTSTNMHIVYNDASGTATTSDLGSSYPCNDSQYNYYITIEQTTTSYIITVERVTVATGASISTSLTTITNIPNYATGVIQLFTFITNNATGAIASYLDGGGIGSFKN